MLSRHAQCFGYRASFNWLLLVVLKVFKLESGAFCSMIPAVIGTAWAVQQHAKLFESFKFGHGSLIKNL